MALCSRDFHDVRRHTCSDCEYDKDQRNLELITGNKEQVTIGSGKRGAFDTLTDYQELCRLSHGKFSSRLPPLSERLIGVGLEQRPDLKCYAWTWFGPIDRFELVKSCKRGHCRKGVSEEWRVLNDEELGFVVLSHEVGERLLQSLHPAEASKVFEAILGLSPFDVLAHVKLSLALLATNSAWRLHHNNAISSDFDTAQKLLIPQILRNAIALEPNNMHLLSIADLILRVVGCVSVYDKYLSEETPRSPGIDACLLLLLRS